MGLPVGIPTAEKGTVGGEWLSGVVARCQILAGRVATEDVDELYALATRALKDGAAPSNRSEGLLLRAVVLDLGFGLLRHLHSRDGLPQSCRCVVANGQSLLRCWNALDRNVLPSFLGWIRTLVDTYRRAHPPTVAERAARLIRECAPYRVATVEIAATCDCAPRTLRRAFLQRYGLSIREYQRTARLVRVVGAVRTGTKIEAVALEAGYRSKKDFYRAFRQVLCLTPAQFRNLPSPQAEQLIDTARSQLVLHAPRRSADHPRRAGVRA